MKIPKKLINRSLDTHKQDFGHVLVVGGSTGLTGAACLTAISALRSGAGLVTAGVPAELSNIFEIKLTEVMTLALNSRKGVLTSGAFIKIKDILLRRKVKVLALGPGLANTSSTRKLTGRILKEIDLPVVLDADGINSISHNLSALKKKT